MNQLLNKRQSSKQEVMGLSPISALKMSSFLILFNYYFRWSELFFVRLSNKFYFKSHAGVDWKN